MNRLKLFGYRPPMRPRPAALGTFTDSGSMPYGGNVDRLVFYDAGVLSVIQMTAADTLILSDAGSPILPIFHATDGLFSDNESFPFPDLSDCLNMSDSSALIAAVFSAVDSLSEADAGTFTPDENATDTFVLSDSGATSFPSFTATEDMFASDGESLASFSNVDYFLTDATTFEPLSSLDTIQVGDSASVSEIFGLSDDIQVGDDFAFAPYIGGDVATAVDSFAWVTPPKDALEFKVVATDNPVYIPKVFAAVDNVTGSDVEVWQGGKNVEVPTPVDVLGWMTSRPVGSSDSLILGDSLTLSKFANQDTMIPTDNLSNLVTK